METTLIDLLTSYVKIAMRVMLVLGGILFGMAFATGQTRLAIYSAFGCAVALIGGFALTIFDVPNTESQILTLENTKIILTTFLHIPLAYFILSNPIHKSIVSAFVTRFIPAMVIVLSASKVTPELFIPFGIILLIYFLTSLRYVNYKESDNAPSSILQVLNHPVISLVSMTVSCLLTIIVLVIFKPNLSLVTPLVITTGIILKLGFRTHRVMT
jgi:hypothetical protein